MIVQVMTWFLFNLKMDSIQEFKRSQAPVKISREAWSTHGVQLVLWYTKEVHIRKQVGPIPPLPQTSTWSLLPSSLSHGSPYSSPSPLSLILFLIFLSTYPWMLPPHFWTSPHLLLFTDLLISPLKPQATTPHYTAATLHFLLPHYLSSKRRHLPLR